MQAIVLTSLGVQWLISSNYRSSQFPFRHLVALGAKFDSARPMLAWGIAFSISALLMWYGILRRNHISAGAGLALASPLLMVYAVLNGWASAVYVQAVPTSGGHPVHIGTFTLLILGLGASVWCYLNTLMLLGRRDNPWLE